jgi:cysteine synthase/rhodanese-related sulfurtransferase
MIDHSTRVYDHVIDMLSGEDNPTPMVRLNKVTGLGVATVYAKLEWYNPFGAVKDRVAANMIRDAEGRGLMGVGQKLVEPTSGNTGMGLAMMANLLGYDLSTPLSNQIPAEKRVMLRFAGAHVEELEDTLCPAPGAPEGAIARAMELGAQPSFHMLNQYENEANFQAHMKTTGPEIWRQTGGRITHFVASLGTCGTVTGNGRYLKAKKPGVKIIGVAPEVGHDIPGVRSLRQLQQTKLFFPDEYDHIVEVGNKDAFEMCLRLVREEGLIAGPSSGLALCGALKIIEDEPDAVVVIMFPDNIFKYASSFQKHFPQFRVAGGGGAPAEPSPKEQMMDALIANNRNPRNTLEVADLRGRLDAGPAPFIVDVRTPSIHAKGHLPGAVNIPNGELAARMDELPDDPGTPIVTVCNRGNASITGMIILQSLGFKDVVSLNGGTFGWEEAGLPILKE